MSAPAIVWTTLIGVLAYVLAVEPLFFNFMLLQVARLTQLAQRQWDRARVHPETPWMRAQINRNADEIATQLLNEINDRPAREPDDDNHPGWPPVA